VNRHFNISKAFCPFSVDCHRMPFLVKSVNGLQILENPSMNLQ